MNPRVAVGGPLVMLVALVAALSVLGVPPATAATPEVGAGGSGSEPPPRLVVVGAPGLAWSDLEERPLDALDRVVENGSGASLTVRAVRSRACTVDGWLTLSSGRRAADLEGDCREPMPVGADGVVPGWADYLAAARSDPFDARPGTLGRAVAASGACVETVGPGAAIAGADRAGRVTHHRDVLPSAFTCPVVIVDAGVLPVAASERAAALAGLDRTLAAVRAADPAADVVVAGVGDGLSPVRPRLLAAEGPSFPRGTLTSPSTRQPGVAQLQDLTATVLTRVGAGGEELSGRPLVTDPATGTRSGRAEERVAFETRAATMRAVSPQVTAWLAVAFAVWAGLVALLWWRRGPVGRMPAALRVLGVTVAVVPVATFTANLLPWWSAPGPAVVFLALLGALTGALTATALWAEGRWPLGALRFGAVLTLVVLAGDVFTGSGLQLGSVFGQNPVVGGRFYGLGNTSFALYGLAVIVVVAWVAGASRWPPRTAGLLGLGLLLTALAVEALPAFGADFGGPPGLLLGGLVTIAGATGVRVTVGRAALGVAVAGVSGVLVAVLDWLRPAERRTHLGDFVETVLSGEAGVVVGRKVAQNLENLGSPPLLAVTLATLVLAGVGWHTGWRPVTQGTVVLRGALVMALVGFVLNDSGLVIPAFVALVLAPLLVAAGPRPDPPAAPVV